MPQQHIQPEYLVIGEVLRPHGVRGEVRMRVLTDNREQLLGLEYVYLANSPADAIRERLELKGVRFNKAYALLTLEGYSHRDDAERLREKVVMIDTDQTAPLEEGQYYLYQLIGMKVVADNIMIGRVKEVIQTGANDVYVVDSDSHDDILVPAHDETITSIDFDAQVITMLLPEGLIPG